MPAPPNHVFTAFTFVGFFLCLLKIPTQFHAWNVGTHLYLGWVGIECLLMGINSIIWNHNTVNWAPVWCDITTRFNVGISIAIPATILCINRRLYLLASPNSLIASQENKKRELAIDLGIGIGLPVLIMALTFFVQSARFMIAEDFGCSMSILTTWLSILIISIPPILLEFTAGVYGCLSIHAFYNRTKENKTFSKNNLNSSRYIRLICFSSFDLLCGIPITLFYLYLTVTNLVPFPGLGVEHYEFSQIFELPASIWRSTTLNELSFELNRWITVWAAFVFFAIFGFTEEARKNYRSMVQTIVKAFQKVTGIKSRRPRSHTLVEGIVFETRSETRSGSESITYGGTSISTKTYHDASYGGISKV